MKYSVLTLYIKLRTPNLDAEIRSVHTVRKTCLQSWQLMIRDLLYCTTYACEKCEMTGRCAVCALPSDVMSAVMYNVDVTRAKFCARCLTSTDHGLHLYCSASQRLAVVTASAGVPDVPHAKLCGSLSAVERAATGGGW